MMPNYQRLLIAIAVLFLIVLARVPFLTQPLVGEEGTFAMLLTGTNSHNVSLVDRTNTGLESRCRLYVAKLDGVDYAATTDRNIFPYCFLTLVVNPITRVFFTEKLTFDQKTFHVRLVFLLITVVGILSILILLVQSSKDVAGREYVILNLLVLYVFTTPLLVGGSIQANLEGSIGVALFGLSSLCAYFGGCEKGNNPRIFIFIAGFLISLGKNEWPLIALLASLISIGAHNLLYRNLIDTLERKNQIRIGITYIYGLFTGILFSYLLSPKDYLDGYLLMTNMNSAHLSIWGLVGATWKLLYPAAALVGFASCLYLFQFKRSFEHGAITSISIATSFGMFAGFLNSGWIGDGFPRYFIPSVISLLPFLFVAVKGLTKYKGNHLTVILIIGLVINVSALLQPYFRGESITSVPGLSMTKLRSDMTLLVRQNLADRNSIPFDHSGIRYYFPDSDMVSNGMGLSGAKFILDKFGSKNMKIIVAPE